jgi:tRNA/tmRNA/rRNA uracil-C5-methylase (TrmA/RlmC/RlmD family)
VARFEGRVVFVRHALPGEQVVAEVTSVRSKLAFADAVEISVASPDRVVPPCPLAHPGGCGGCDLQHVDLAAQRRWKGGVVSGQLRRIAGLDVPVVVEPVPGDAAGLDWRTRMRYATGADGQLGLRRHRSHDVIRVEVCPIAQPALPAVTDLPWPGTASVEAVLSGTGERLVVVEPGARPRVHVPSGLEADGVLTTDGARLRGRTHLHESAAGRTWRVTGSGFWQVHPGAAETFAAAVLEMLDPQPGESALDLYSGVGLFAGAIAERVGELGRVTAVEGSTVAVADARRNLHDLPQVSLVAGRVEEALLDGSVSPHADVVVLDPPRVGAGAEVVAGVVARTPRAVVYVACDPAALARDVGSFVEAGFALSAIRGFDAFPMTHHVECLALLTPTS